MQKVTITHIELYYIVPVDIVPKTSVLIDNELNNLVGDKVFESLENKKFGLKFQSVIYIVYTCSCEIKW